MGFLLWKQGAELFHRLAKKFSNFDMDRLKLWITNRGTWEIREQRKISQTGELIGVRPLFSPSVFQKHYDNELIIFS